MGYGIDSMASMSQLTIQNTNIPKINENTDDKELREQTDAFEAVIIKMLMDNAAKNNKDMFSSQKDPGDKIYKSMYRDELSKASAGGFGFSQMLYEYLSREK